jgi:hypothetical protein
MRELRNKEQLTAQPGSQVQQTLFASGLSMNHDIESLQSRIRSLESKISVENPDPTSTLNQVKLKKEKMKQKLDKLNNSITRPEVEQEVSEEITLNNI